MIHKIGLSAAVQNDTRDFFSFLFLGGGGGLPEFLLILNFNHLLERKGKCFYPS